MRFSGIQKTTLIDYPGKVATTLFTYGCNFRCPFCHNPELVVEKEGETITDLYVLDFLKSRVGKLDGVVITGGEPLLHQSSPAASTRRDYELVDFIRKVKNLGFLVKVDTNGSFPERIRELYKYVDYWAMDVKNSPQKYSITAKADVSLKKIKESIKLLMSGKTDYEFRTTVVPGLHDISSMRGVGELIKGCRKYTIQNFRGGKTVDKNYENKKGFSLSELKTFKEVVKPFVKEVNVIEN